MAHKFQKGDRVRYVCPGHLWDGMYGTVDRATGPTRFRVFLEANWGHRVFGMTTDEKHLERV